MYFSLQQKELVKHFQEKWRCGLEERGYDGKGWKKWMRKTVGSFLTTLLGFSLLHGKALFYNWYKNISQWKIQITQQLKYSENPILQSRVNGI